MLGILVYPPPKKIVPTHDMKAHRLDVQRHSFLTLTSDGGEWSASCPSHFNNGQTAPSSLGRGVWVGPRAGVDILENGSISCPCWDLIPALSSP